MKKLRYMSARKRETLTAWLLLSPALTGFLIFYLIPFGESVWYSLLSDMFRKDFVGLDNYARLFGNEFFLRGMGNTLLFILLGVPLGTLGGLMFALMFRHITKGATFFKTVLLAALVLPASSVAVVWNAFFAKSGVLNGIVAALGGESIDWLASGHARIVVMLLYLWRNIGYNMVVFTAGLAAIPREYYEIARLEGATAFQNFKYVTAPMLKGSFAFVTIMSITGGFKVFREVYALVGAYPHDSIYMLQSFMNNLFLRLDYQRLCASAVTIVVVVLTPIYVAIRTRKSDG